MKRIWNGRNAAIGAMIVGAGFLLSTQLLAQSGPQTPEEAAKKFTDAMYLAAYKDGPRSPAIDPMDLISRKDFLLLEWDGVREVVGNLAYDMRLSSYQAKTAGKTPKSAVVNVTSTNPTLGTKAVVVIREGNVWRVDLVKTFTRWSKLDEKTALRRISSLSGVLLPGLPADERVLNTTCQNNLRRLALGVLQYSQDYDEKLPPAHEWNNTVQPYVARNSFDRTSSFGDDDTPFSVRAHIESPAPASTRVALPRIFHCPKIGSNKYGYAMNGSLHRGNWGLIETPAQTVLFFDSRRMYRNAFGSENDVAFRHQPAEAGANYAFADGHVAWRSSRQKQSFEPRFSVPNPPEMRVPFIPGAPPGPPVPNN